MAAWLNYHHLLYFWTVAKSGTVAKAATELRLAQPTVSAQVKMLEESLGQALFQRQGRRLVLTDIGRTVMRYADEIFRVGRELQSVVAGAPVNRPLRLEVGVTDVVPKLVAEELIRPALRSAHAVRLVCREGSLTRLLAKLAVHELDVVIADAPASGPVSVKVFNHLLGKSELSFFAPPKLGHLKKNFPRSLDRAPMLLQSEGNALRTGLDTWFARNGWAPEVVGEFEDSALLAAFGHRGLGVFALPRAIENEVCRQFGVTVIGHTPEVVATYYAISAERRLRHPAVVTLAESARSELFR